MTSQKKQAVRVCELIYAVTLFSVLAHFAFCLFRGVFCLFVRLVLPPYKPSVLNLFLIQFVKLWILFTLLCVSLSYICFVCIVVSI